MGEAGDLLAAVEGIAPDAETNDLDALKRRVSERHSAAIRTCMRREFRRAVLAACVFAAVALAGAWGLAASLTNRPLMWQDIHSGGLESAFLWLGVACAELVLLFGSAPYLRRAWLIVLVSLVVTAAPWVLLGVPLTVTICVITAGVFAALAAWGRAREKRSLVTTDQIMDARDSGLLIDVPAYLAAARKRRRAILMCWSALVAIPLFAFAPWIAMTAHTARAQAEAVHPANYDGSHGAIELSAPPPAAGRLTALCNALGERRCNDLLPGTDWSRSPIGGLRAEGETLRELLFRRPPRALVSEDPFLARKLRSKISEPLAQLRREAAAMAGEDAGVLSHNVRRTAVYYLLLSAEARLVEQPPLDALGDLHAALSLLVVNDREGQWQLYDSEQDLNPTLTSLADALDEQRVDKGTLARLADLLARTSSCPPVRRDVWKRLVEASSIRHVMSYGYYGLRYLLSRPMHNARLWRNIWSLQLAQAALPSDNEAALRGLVDGRTEFGLKVVPRLTESVKQELAWIGSRHAMDVRRIRILRVAVAERRYRLDHEGRIPPSAEALVPGYLDGLPKDPATGRAMGLLGLGENLSALMTEELDGSMYLLR